MLSIFGLFGVAAALGLFVQSDTNFDESSEEETDQFDMLDSILVSDIFESQESESPEYYDNVSSNVSQIFPTLTDIHFDSNNFPISVEVLETDPVDVENEGLDDNAQYFEVLAEDGLSPVEDWTSNSSFPIIELNESEDLFIEVFSENATVLVHKADYTERVGSEFGSEINMVHTGANIFILEDGQAFPDNIQWSETGAVSYIEHCADECTDSLNEIRHVARIDTGLIYGSYNADDTQLLSQEVFESLQNRLTSNEVLRFVD